jgi:hypothetical protein
MGQGENRRLEKLRQELQRLMLEQVESLQDETFAGASREEKRKQDERLKHIREVSAELLSALKNGQG